MADTTLNRGYVKPVPANKLKNDVGPMRATLDAIDADIQAALTGVSNVQAALGSKASQTALNDVIATVGGKANAATSLAGYGIADVAPDLVAVTTDVSTAAVNGRHHVLITPGITLSAPTAPADKFRFAFTNASAGNVSVAWGARTVKGSAPNPTTMLIPSRSSACVEWSAAANTWIEA